jgi:hypothetical protein
MDQEVIPFVSFKIAASIVSSAEKNSKYGNACKMCFNKVFAIVLKWILLLELSKMKMSKFVFHCIMMSISKLTVKSLENLLVSLWKLVIKKAISYVISSQ